MNLSINEQITFFHTADLDKTDHFYQTVLNRPCVLDQGDCRIYQITPTSYIGFCRHLSPFPISDGRLPAVLFTLVTDEVDGWYEHLVEQGVIIEKRPAHNEKYQLYHFFCQDPNGYTIEIQQFLNANWSKVS